MVVLFTFLVINGLSTWPLSKRCPQTHARMQAIAGAPSNGLRVPVVYFY